MAVLDVPRHKADAAATNIQSLSDAQHVKQYKATKAAVHGQ